MTRAFVMWICEILLMMVIALACPEALTYDSMTGGLAFALLAWIPAGMFWMFLDD